MQSSVGDISRDDEVITRRKLGVRFVGAFEELGLHAQQDAGEPEVHLSPGEGVGQRNGLDGDVSGSFRMRA